MTTELFERLFDHMWWADGEVEEALSRETKATDGLIHLYAHILGTEINWLDRVEGVDRTVAVWPDENLEGCKKLASQTRDRYQAFLNNLDDSKMAVTVQYRNSAGASFESRLDDILLHVGLHGAYHRGQIARGIKTLGGEPNPTDYIGFIRGVPAATRADSGSDGST